MDCLNEWDRLSQAKENQWLLQLGVKMLAVDEARRADLMQSFVNRLLREGIVANPLGGWVLCAEVYANAMALRELQKVSMMINTKGV